MDIHLSNLDMHTLFIRHILILVYFTRFKKYKCFKHLYIILMLYLSRVFLIVKVSFIGFG